MPDTYAIRRWLRAAFGAAALCACVPAVFAQSEAPAWSAWGLDGEIADLLDADPAPRIALDPAERYALVVRSRQLLPLDRLAAPAVEVAGRRVNPGTAAPHAPIEYYALTLIDLQRGARTEIPLPRGSVVEFPQWAPDGSRFVFSLTRRDSQMELWVGEPTEARARPLLTGINGARSASCGFTPRSDELLCRRLVRSHLQTLWENRNRQDSWGGGGEELFLERGLTPLDQATLRGLLESQLELVNVRSGQRHAIGQPAAFNKVVSSPAGGYLLVERIVQPYPRLSGVDPVRMVTEIWNRYGEVLATLPDTSRSISWQANHPARVVWVEHRDDADRVVSVDAPFDSDPEDRFKLDGRFAGLRWIGDRDLALVTDYDSEQRETKFWAVPFVSAQNAESRMLMRYPSGNTRIPLMKSNRYGMSAVRVSDDAFVVRGQNLAGAQQQVFLERIDLATGQAERFWNADHDRDEQVIDVLGDEADFLVIREQSPSEPPRYVLRSRDERVSYQITDDRHPVSTLVDADRRRLEYTRADGTELSASIYLPPGYRGGDKLPLIVWAYPQRVPAGSSARLPDTTGRFPTFDRAFRHFFLLRGYAVLDDVSMPIVGDDATANDTFIDQIVANAEAAVDAAVATGAVDSYRIGVAGHSYGAFMVANLLAHSRIFSAGVALSGAYNRTLTPFGFQTERRTLWDAPDTYLAMSPVIFADQVEAPLLLVHGLLDDNAGTAPLQSTQFFKAIRGNGGEAELMLLPWEGHEYRGRESVFRAAGGMLDWFDRHMQSPTSTSNKNTGALLRP